MASTTATDKKSVTRSNKVQSPVEPEASSLHNLKETLEEHADRAEGKDRAIHATPETAFLVSPDAGSRLHLSEEECGAVISLIEWRRSGGKELDALYSALYGTSQEVEKIQALLVEPGEKPTYLREKGGTRELGCVKALLTILRAGGWFAEYLGFILELFAQKPPTPADVIESLSESAEHFALDVADAKHMMRRWPHLFA